MLEPGYRASLLAEVRRVQDSIDPSDLAVQWDIAIEPAMWEEPGGSFPRWFDDVHTGTLDRIGQAAAGVDTGVEVGFHLCYGDFGHEQFTQPADTSIITEIVNGIVQRMERPIAWIHLLSPSTGTTRDTSHRCGT